jgi:hypothetical protein
MYVAPKSTEVTGWQAIFGSTGTVRGTISTTNGIANTNTLYAFGNTTASGHPAAYYCKNLTTGGYNTWYLPAKVEMLTMWSNKSAKPFATANSFALAMYFTSTEYSGGYSWGQYMNDGRQTNDNFQGKRYTGGVTRAVRMSLV